MKRDRGPLQQPVGPQAPDLARGSCGHIKAFTVNGLTGVVTEHCDDCEREAERAKIRANYQEQAITFLAAVSGRSVEALKRFLRIVEKKIEKPKPARPCRCGCGEPARFHGSYHEGWVKPAGVAGIRHHYAQRLCLVCPRKFTPNGPTQRRCLHKDCPGTPPPRAA